MSDYAIDALRLAFIRRGLHENEAIQKCPAKSGVLKIWRAL
ncbi:hypothetical protein F441_01134 [Phytophthora nicotianae CJ01A1]|nr:hypothetical protein F443_01159 [Phytophthora nicotianae P1569]ETP26116.1 hypothetical protein F441_01134 [Phytophthora nicotianae CJ01A1]ETP28290.1 hypothetical protein F442_22420 [Phytophthora nicotianae P10297]